MSILKILRRIPEFLLYQEYWFKLGIKGDYIGYFLISCSSRKKYKKEAFKQGYWLEKVKHSTSSNGSDYLVKVLLFDDEDTTYLQALTALQQFLQENGIAPFINDAITEDTEWTEIIQQFSPLTKQ